MRQSRQTPSGADAVLQHAPAACKRMAVVTTVGREHRPPPLLLPVCQSRRALLRPGDATAVRHHDARLPGVTQAGQPVMAIVAPPLRLTRGDDLREALRGALVDGAEHAAHPPAGAAAPRAILPPRLACEAGVACEVALAQWPGREASAWGVPPPAGAGQGTAPPDGGLVLQPHARAPAGPGRQGGACERRPCPRSRLGRKPPRGTARAAGVFSLPRGRSRGSCTYTLRINTPDSPIDCIKDKKVYKRGPS